MQIACPCASASIADAKSASSSWLSSVLVMPSANGGPCREPRGQRARFVHQRLRRDDLVHQPDPQRLVGGDPVAEHQQLGRARQPDDPREQVRGAHVGSREADLREQERQAGLRDGEPKIGRERDHRSGACRDAIDRRDHRLRERPDIRGSARRSSG